MSVETAIIIALGVVVLLLAAAILILLRRQTGSGASDLLDQQLDSMKQELGKVSDLVRELEKDREGKFGELSAQLKSTAQQTAALSTTTGALREALANSRARGQWGERMAEDVLRLIGFVEGVNYVKQKSLDDSQSRPDFTFFLPKDLKLNMDVKFPLDNYLRSVNAEASDEELRYRAAFLRDVRGRLNEVATKDYIDAKQSTLGCVLLFIPNEQIYQFIHEHDHALIDESLKKQVVLCSPMSLFAILVVIRQAVDNFTVEQTSNQIVAELGLFNQQWEQFLKKLDDVGKRIDASQREYQTLITTRRRALERPLNRIEDLRRSRGISLPEDEALAEPANLFEPLLESLDSSPLEQ
ncbi:MAG: DNA recombination protein RmuC [Chloroflexi bacterium]|nr:DNA recombination protein RmuC [Chloroflexota bacterium]MDA1218615.1 DNA recombination protein RmuC [Chloroflexota bacterium]PKB57029.1 MAG: hypothetical protein BZY73_05275 [SAR202 cluster bacterium Casp-Chloro-G3]